MTAIKKADATIADLIREIVKPMIHVQSMNGTVKSIDLDNETCVIDPDDEGPELHDVRLTAVVDGKDSRWLIIPEEGSDVTVSILGNNPNVAYISQFSKIKKVVWDCKEIVVNSGSNGGLVIVGKLVERLNALETKFNALLASYKTHVHTGGTIMGSTGNVTPVPLLSQAEATKQADIENTQFKH